MIKSFDDESGTVTIACDVCSDGADDDVEFSRSISEFVAYMSETAQRMIRTPACPGCGCVSFMIVGGTVGAGDYKHMRRVLFKRLVDDGHVDHKAIRGRSDADSEALMNVAVSKLDADYKAVGGDKEKQFRGQNRVNHVAEESRLAGRLKTKKRVAAIEAEEQRLKAEHEAKKKRAVDSNERLKAEKAKKVSVGEPKSVTMMDKFKQNLATAMGVKVDDLEENVEPEGEKKAKK